MKEQDADIVIGSKLHPESKLHYPMLRKIMSYGYYLMLKMMFHLNTHDTQTGIKLFKKEVIKPIVSRMQAEGYAFDIEILAMAAKDGRKICEAPIELNYSRDDSKGGRRIGLKDVFKVFGETVAVKKRVKNYIKILFLKTFFVLQGIIPLLPLKTCLVILQEYNLYI